MAQHLKDQPALEGAQETWVRSLGWEDALEKGMATYYTFFPEKFLVSQFSSVQSLSCVRLFATPWTAAHEASLSIQLLESTQTHVHWVSDAIQPSHPLSSPSPPALNLSQHQGLFKWVSSLHQVAKEVNANLMCKKPFIKVTSFLLNWSRF